MQSFTPSTVITFFTGFLSFITRVVWPTIGNNSLSLQITSNSPSSIKIGTKVKNIRLVPDAADGHDIECKIDGFGAMKLKSSVVKKA